MKKWVEWILIALGTLVLLLAVAYFLTTRPFFIRTFVFPRIQQATNVTVQAEGIVFSPFRSLELQSVSFQHGDLALKGKIKNFECKYSAFSFLTGSPQIDSVRITGLSGSFSRPAGPDRSPISCTWQDAALQVTGIRGDHDADLQAKANLSYEQPDDLYVKNALLDLTGSLHLNADLKPRRGEIKAILSKMQGQVQDIPLEDRRGNLVAEFDATDESWTLRNADLTLKKNQQLDLKASVQGNGALQPFTANLQFDVKPVTAQALNIAGGFYHGLNFGQASIAQYHGTATYTEERGITSEGTLSLDKAVITSDELGLTGLPTLAVQIKHDGEYNMRKKSSLVRSLEASLTLAGQQALSVKLTSPVEVRLPGGEQTELAFEPSNLHVVFSEFPLKLVNLVLAAPDGPRIQSGTLSANLTAAIQDQGEDARITGPLNVQDLTVDLPDETARINQVAVTYRLNVELAGMQNLTLAPETIEVSAENQPVISVSPELSYDLDAKSGSYTITLRKLTPALARLLPETLAQNAAFKQLESKGGIEGSFDLETKRADAAYDLQVPALQFSSSKYGLSPVIKGSLTGRCSFADKTLTFEPTVLDSSADQNRLAHLALEGVAAIPLTAGKTELDIKSAGIDADMLRAAATVVRQVQADITKQRESAEAEKPTPPGVEEPPTEKPAPEEPRPGPAEKKPTPVPAPQPRINAVAHLDLQHIVYRKIFIQSCKGNLYYQGTQVKTDGLDVTLNGAPLTVRGAADLGTALPEYDLKATLGSLNIDPFLQSFDLTSASNLVDADLQSLAMDISGRGFTIPDLRRHLAGTADLSVGLLSISGWDKLADFARKQNIPELESLLFNQGHVAVNAEDGRILLQDARLAGKNLKIALGGNIGLDRTLALTAELAAGGPLLERLVSRGYDQILQAPKNGYRPLPTSIPIGGTWSNPKLDFSLKSMLRNSLKEKGRDAVRETIKQLEEGKDPDLEGILKGILGGGSTRQPSSEEDSQPVPEDEAAPDSSETETSEEEKSDEEKLKDTGRSILRQLLEDED